MVDLDCQQALSLSIFLQEHFNIVTVNGKISKVKSPFAHEQSVVGAGFQVRKALCNG